MTTTYNQLVDSIVTELQENFSEGTDLADLARNVLLTRENDFRTAFAQTKGGSMGKKASRKSTKKTVDPNKTTKTNWQAIWTSTVYGCSSYPPFADKIREIRETATQKCDDNKKPNQFKLNNELQTWAKSGDGSMYRAWMEYSREKLLADGKPLPSEPKGETQKPKGPRKSKRNGDEANQENGETDQTVTPPAPAPAPVTPPPTPTPTTPTPTPPTPTPQAKKTARQPLMKKS